MQTPPPTSDAARVGELSNYNGFRQPSIATRLNQIDVFLTDEDLWRTPLFKEKLEEVRKYIRDLRFGSQAREDYEILQLEQICEKIAVHDKWIREAEEVADYDFDDVNEGVEYEKPTSQGRLMPKWWTPDSGLVKNELANLPKVQKMGWPRESPEAKIHLSLVDLRKRRQEAGYIGEIEPEKNDEEEQDPWEYTKKVADLKEQIAAVARAWKEDADITMRHYKELKSTTTGIVKDGKEVPGLRFDPVLVKIEVSPFAFNPMPANFNDPFLPPSAEQLHKCWHDKYTELSDLIQDLLQAHEKAPRKILTAIVNTLIDKNLELDQADQAVAISGGEHWTLANKYLHVKDWLDSDYDTLKIFTGPARVKARRNCKFKGEEASFAQRVQELMRDHTFWPESVNFQLPILDLMTRACGIQPNLRLSEAHLHAVLKGMHDDGRIVVLVDKDQKILGVSRPYPTDLPEDRESTRGRYMPDSEAHYIPIAERLIGAYRTLDRNLMQIDQDPHYMRDIVVPDFADNLRQRVRYWEALVGPKAIEERWIELAKPLVPWERREALGLESAVRALGERMAKEGNANREETAEPEHIWGWTDRTWYKDAGDRFHVRRWDPKVQREGEEKTKKLEEAENLRRQAAINKGEDPDKMDVDEEPEEVYEPAPTKYYPGKQAFFPFSETPQVDAVMQKLISDTVWGPQHGKKRRRRQSHGGDGDGDGDDDQPPSKRQNTTLGPTIVGGRIVRPVVVVPNPAHQWANTANMTSTMVARLDAARADDRQRRLSV